MRILHVIAGLNENAGGTSEFVARVCEELVRQGHPTSILTLEDGNAAAAVLHAVDIGVAVTFCRLFANRWRTLSYSREFASKIKTAVQTSDVIHLHGLWQWPCWKAAQEAIRQKKPFVMQTHGFLESERLKKSPVKKAIIGSLFERPHLSAARRVIATAESERESIISYGVKTPIEIVPIGIDTCLIDKGRHDTELLQRLGVPKGKKVLLYLSRLAPIKGLDLLAEAWLRLQRSHHDWHLLIVGADTQGYSDVIKCCYARKITDGSVSFPGPVYGKDKFNLLKSADVFVLPTRSENFSIAVQEALAAGVPVVCTKGAPWQKIEEVGAGRCVDISVEGIVKGLDELMNMTEAERFRMGQNGTAFIRAEFRWPEIGAKLLSIYESVIREC